MGGVLLILVVMVLLVLFLLFVMFMVNCRLEDWVFFLFSIRLFGYEVMFELLVLVYVKCMVMLLVY